MPKLMFTEGFIDDVAEKVEPADKRRQIKAACSLLADFPQMGTAVIRESLVRLFGKGVRKLSVSPFVIVYEYRPDAEEVLVLGLMHSKQVV